MLPGTRRERSRPATPGSSGDPGEVDERRPVDARARRAVCARERRPRAVSQDACQPATASAQSATGSRHGWSVRGLIPRIEDAVHPSSTEMTGKTCGLQGRLMRRETAGESARLLGLLRGRHARGGPSLALRARARPAQVRSGRGLLRRGGRECLDPVRDAGALRAARAPASGSAARALHAHAVRQAAHGGRAGACIRAGIARALALAGRRRQGKAAVRRERDLDIRAGVRPVSRPAFRRGEEEKRPRKSPKAVNWLLGGSHSLAIALVAAFLVPASAVGAFALPTNVVGHLAAPFRSAVHDDVNARRRRERSGAGTRRLGAVEWQRLARRCRACLRAGRLRACRQHRRASSRDRQPEFAARRVFRSPRPSACSGKDEATPWWRRLAWPAVSERGRYRRWIAVFHLEPAGNDDEPAPPPPADEEQSPLGDSGDSEQADASAAEEPSGADASQSDPSGDGPAGDSRQPTSLTRALRPRRTLAPMPPASPPRRPTRPAMGTATATGMATATGTATATATATGRATAIRAARRPARARRTTRTTLPPVRATTSGERQEGQREGWQVIHVARRRHHT